LSTATVAAGAAGGVGGALGLHAVVAIERALVLGSCERRRLARGAGPADRFEKVLESGRRDQPEHHELLVGLVDDLVLDLVAEEARGARYQRMVHAVDHHPPAATEADLQLDLVSVRVLAHAAARRDGL